MLKAVTHYYKSVQKHSCPLYRCKLLTTHSSLKPTI